jgi:cell fate regulator YaaT (PSP1 superfamily)
MENKENNNGAQAGSQAEKPSVKRKVAGVIFSRAGKIEYYLAEGVVLSSHDVVVVKGEHGNTIGRVVVPPHDVSADNVATNIKEVVRKANKDDLEKYEQGLEKARQSFELCEQKIKERVLPMKLVDVSFEDNKAIFFFFAEERIDFRALVKDLASSLHMRIEMRQIGARDEARAIGALGPCGLNCCCETFLSEFKSISIAMAKNQGLSPNPAKLTGMCGKLKCCLSYENEAYLEERKGLPPMGAKVQIREGTGNITNIDVLKHSCTVRVETGDGYEDVRCKCEECKLLSRPRTREKERAEKDEADKEYEKLEG